MTQATALSLLSMGHNVFLTGSAGSGKTYVLNQYIGYLRNHNVDVAVTASTGIAATHMGGMTIHAWSGIGIRRTMSDWEIEALEEKQYLWKRYESVKVLVIDEVSMLSGEFLDLLDRVCRSMKRKDEPFGGIQVVLCGDLFQLPPISKGEESVTFVTESKAWSTIGLLVCYLSEQHRQDDSEFLSILNAIRDGNFDTYHEELLQSRIREDMTGIEHMTKLFTHNVDVDSINGQKLAEIADQEFVYDMKTTGRELLVETLKKSCLAVPVLALKKGAEVMFVKNNSDAGYVNGTRGEVIGFSADRAPLVLTLEGDTISVSPETWSIEEDGKVKASITQIPLRHAWAITIHKSQGMSLDAAVMDLSKSFASGMGYVALSRVRRLSGLYLLGISPQALYIDERVREADAVLRSQSQKSEESLARLTSEEVKLLADTFLLKSGGTLDTTPRAKKSPKIATHYYTYDLVSEGKTIEEVASERDLAIGTIISHLETCKEEGKDVSFEHLKLDPEDMDHIIEAFEETGETKLTPVKSLLEKKGHVYNFETIRLVRLFLE